MRILYVNGKNNNGGANIALLNIIKGMLQKRHEVHVITDSRDGFFLDEVKSINCYLHTCPCALNIKVSKRVNNPITIFNYYCFHFVTWINQWRYMRKVIREIKPDIVHTNVGPLTTAARICSRHCVPHVWHIREYNKALGFSPFPTESSFERSLHQKNNHCIAITKGLFDFNKMHEDKDCYIYDGVFSESELKRLPVVEKEDYILFVGRIEKSKGVIDLIKAYTRCATKISSKLALAGSYTDSDVYYKRCKDIVSKANLEDRVEFLGVRKDVYELMSKAKCLVVPSPMEGFGFITAEAMLNYCLVIGKDAYGTKEQFDNGLLWCGKEIAYRYNSEEELTTLLQIVTLSDNSEIVNRAHTVLANYTIENNVNQIEIFYKKILNYESM